MSKENNIKKGLLSEKMSNFSVEPPEGAWENISSRLGGGSSRKFILIVLASAAGLALAITVGVNLIDRTPDLSMAEKEIIESESEDLVSSEIAVETLEETPLNYDERDALKIESSSDTRINLKRQTKLEEKVLIAMEEVIDEMEVDEDFVVAENITREQDGEDLTGNELTDKGKELDEQTDTEDDTGTAQEDIEEQGRIDTEQKLAVSLDSIASQNYLDSLASQVVNKEIVPDKSDSKNRWQIGASLSPIYSYRDASSQDVMQNQAVNSSERGRLSYSGGVKLSYLSSERLSIESGLYYNRMGLAIGDFTRFKSNLDFFVGEKAFYDNSIVSLSNSIGTIATKNEDVFVNAYASSAAESLIRIESADMSLQDDAVSSYEQSLEYLEIPFNLKYKVINRDFKVLLIGGFSTNLLVGNSVSANTSNGKIDYGSVQDIRSVNYSGNAGLGFVYSFSGNLSLSVEPRFRYYLNSVNNASLPTTRPYVMGLYTGVNYSF